MSFSSARGQINPVVTYYYDTGAQQRFTLWHIAGVFVLLLIAMTLFVAKAVTSNVQFAGAEPTVLSANVSPPSPVSNVVTPIVETNELQTDIDTWIKAHKGVDWAVSVDAIEGDLSASVNADKTYTIASIYKLFLLQPLAQKIPSDEWATTTLQSKTYAACVDAMLRVSDNACAEAIGGMLNWGKAEKYLRSLGYAKTAFTGATTTGTASETTALLKNLHNSEGFDPLTRDLALKAMMAPKSTEGIRRGCEDCTVYNKTGDLAGFHNDAAIVIKNGKTYVVAIFSKTGSWGQIAELTKVISTHF